MIMSYLTGTTVDRHDIDAEIRRFDVFSAPDDLIGYARRAGLPAEGYNHGTAEDLERFIDAGVPCELLISADGSSNLARLHCVVAVGHHRDPQSGETVFTLHDPVQGQIDTRWSDLERRWSAPPVGFDHYFIAVGRPGTPLPPGRPDGVEGTLAAADGLATVMNSFPPPIHPDRGDDPVADLRAIETGAEHAFAGAVRAITDAAEDARGVLETSLRRLFG
jgi:hypothetical protein